MTSNQIRAMSLAEQIRRGSIDAKLLTEHDWYLLLLAAGLNNCDPVPYVVADRVLASASAEQGYFER